MDGDGLPSDSNVAWGGWRDIECTAGADNRVYLERRTRNATNGRSRTSSIVSVMIFSLTGFFSSNAVSAGIEFVERRDEVDFGMLTTLGGATNSLEARYLPSLASLLVCGVTLQLCVLLSSWRMWEIKRSGATYFTRAANGYGSDPRVWKSVALVRLLFFVSISYFCAHHCFLANDLRDRQTSPT